MQTLMAAGGLLMAPIAADYLHLPSDKPSSFAIINEAASVCNGSCAFTFNETLNPKLTGAMVTLKGVSQSTVNLLGTNLLPQQGLDGPISYIRVYVRRNTTTLMTNTTASVWMVESCSVTEADSNDSSCRRALLASCHSRKRGFEQHNTYFRCDSILHNSQYGTAHISDNSKVGMLSLAWFAIILYLCIRGVCRQ
jgi:hypothetical protein